MSNVHSIFRTLITFSLVVPLAIILGYQLASLDPAQDMYTWMAVGTVLLLLTFPLLMRWHHPFLLLSWNSAAYFVLLPGQPALWLLMAFFSLGLSIVQRATSREMKFLSATSVALPLLFLAAVIAVTMKMNGDFGLRVLGSQSFGGRRYFALFAAVAGFFAIIAHQPPPQKAALYVGLFFLGSIADILCLLSLLGPPFDYILYVFPFDNSRLGGDFGSPLTRSVSLSQFCTGIFLFVLSRYGLKESLEKRKFLRLSLLAGVLLLGALSGFRSFLIPLILTLLVIFYFEGLVRSKYAVMLLVGIALAAALLVPFANKLPLSMQRTLSFLPLDINPIARYDAQGSTEWRLQMWQALLPEVSQHLWLGKGLGMKGAQLELTSEMAFQGRLSSQEVAMIAGDYHSGPLSLIIPFGIWGVIGFLWFLIASLRALYLNYRHGDESLKTINTFLLAYFIVRTFHFIFIFGGFYSDLARFVGLIGLSLSLNGGLCKAVRAQEVSSPAPFRLRDRLREPSALPQPAGSR